MNGTGISHLADLVRRRSGIALADDKAELISHRLSRVARVFGFKDGATLLAELAHPHEELASAVTEAMTTQDTCFFRDPEVFDFLDAAFLPGLIADRAAKKRLRLWSAGCATGQEAYSVAMLLAEQTLAAKGWAVDLLATDISGDAIARAKAGLYADHDMSRGLPAVRRLRHFYRDGEGWRVRERLRRSVTFRTFNLLDDFGWLGEMDVILCRNVLMHFDSRVRSAVLRKIFDTLAADGMLIVGALEMSLGPAFVPVSGLRGAFTKAQGETLHAMQAVG